MIQENKELLSTMLWRDLKTDEDRANWLLMGRGYETGVIALAVQNGIALAYQRLAALQAQGDAVRDAVLKEAEEACERVQDECSSRNSGKWPELQETADMGAGECVAAIRALRSHQEGE